jgi:hypothetical protein
VNSRFKNADEGLLPHRHFIFLKKFRLPLTSTFHAAIKD